MALCGVLCAAIYDLARWVASRIGGRILCGVADLLFGPLCAAGMIASALALCADPFRAFEAAGLFFGIALYAATIGTFVRFIYEKIAILRKKSEESGGLFQNVAGK